MCYSTAVGNICLGGGNATEGNVFINSRPICDDGWDDYEAKIVCNQIGFQLGIATDDST